MNGNGYTVLSTSAGGEPVTHFSSTSREEAAVVEELRSLGHRNIQTTMRRSMALGPVVVRVEVTTPRDGEPDEADEGAWSLREWLREWRRRG